MILEDDLARIPVSFRGDTNRSIRFRVHPFQGVPEENVKDLLQGLGGQIGPQELAVSVLPHEAHTMLGKDMYAFGKYDFVSGI